ncbi:unnamed protein product [Nesidiocoris tenuis]|uniref:Uncharacterized protein n=1 Tax=Nesidiocoris tenuis TaxID=355587 RepID=A0A6H5HLI0_9HEMI|nr:unnamed protein product [Nesidiocoris tenuis]
MEITSPTWLLHQHIDCLHCRIGGTVEIIAFLQHPPVMVLFFEAIKPSPRPVAASINFSLYQFHTATTTTWNSRKVELTIDSRTSSPRHNFLAFRLRQDEKIESWLGPKLQPNKESVGTRSAGLFCIVSK